jgi:hypothetical protein
MRPPRQTPGSRWLRGAAASALLAAACGTPPQEAPPQPPQAQSPPAAAPAYSQNPAVPPAYTGELPPLPISGYPAARPPEVVRAVYEFAARHPEVLSYVPCFCGCERSAGHTDNHDCFIRGRDADGRPQWDGHGAG